MYLRYQIFILTTYNPLSNSNLSIYYEIILDKTILALYLFFCISCNINEFISFRILFMDSIPLQLLSEVETLLRNRSVPTGVHPHYKKWLRFYLDFCRKYRFMETERISLEHFLRKLQEKKQTDLQRQQASHAIMLYYELNEKKGSISKAYSEVGPLSLPPENPAQSEIQQFDSEKSSTGKSWMDEYTRLSDDVKAFLTFPAVTKKVSATLPAQLCRPSASGQL